MQTISTEAGGPAAGAPRLRAEAILRSVRVVLFDAVGTLLFPDPPVAEAYFQAGRRHGSHLNRHEVRDRFQRSFTRSHQGGCSSEVVERQRWQTIVAEVFDDVPTSNRDALFQELWSHFEAPPSWKLFDDVPGVWDELRRRGKQLGIASNFDARLITLCRTLAPLDTAERVFCSSQVGYCKPDHRFFLAIQQQLGVEADEILLVGDDPRTDFGGASAAGWHALLIDRTGAVAGAMGDLADLLA